MAVLSPGAKCFVLAAFEDRFVCTTAQFHSSFKALSRVCSRKGAFSNGMRSKEYPTRSSSLGGPSGSALNFAIQRNRLPDSCPSNCDPLLCSPEILESNTADARSVSDFTSPENISVFPLPALPASSTNLWKAQHAHLFQFSAHK